MYRRDGRTQIHNLKNATTKIYEKTNKPHTWQSFSVSDIWASPNLESCKSAAATYYNMHIRT